MSKYTKWEQLNEALGFPLGVKSSVNLGLASSYDLSEKKKKMDVEPKPEDEEDDEEEVEDDEEEVEDDEEEVEDDEEEVEDDEEEVKDDELKKKGSCSCDKPELGDKLMCKKCMKPMKKNMKKKMKKNESIFASYDVEPGYIPTIGTEEYRQHFFKSLESYNDNPNRKYKSGINLDEEVIFEPQNEQMPKPIAGQPGSSPYTRIGGEENPITTVADWEKEWRQIGEQFLDKLSDK